MTYDIILLQSTMIYLFVALYLIRVVVSLHDGDLYIVSYINYNILKNSNLHNVY